MKTQLQGEEFFYPNKYPSYQASMMIVIENVLIERLKLLHERKFHYHDWSIETKMGYNLENTEMHLRYYIRVYGDKELPIFEGNYGNKKISLQHYRSIIQYLQQKLVDERELK